MIRMNIWIYSYQRNDMNEFRIHSYQKTIRMNIWIYSHQKNHTNMIRTNIRIGKYSNIFISKKRYERISEYIRIKMMIRTNIQIYSYQKRNMNEYLNIFASKKWYEYDTNKYLYRKIFEYPNIRHTLVQTSARSLCQMAALLQKNHTAITVRGGMLEFETPSRRSRELNWLMTMHLWISKTQTANPVELLPGSIWWIRIKRAQIKLFFFVFVRSCLYITPMKCLKGHKSLEFFF